MSIRHPAAASAVLLGAAALAALSASPAHAAPCNTDLIDSASTTWVLDLNGGFSEAGEDAFDSSGLLVDGNGDGTAAAYPNATPGTCAIEDGGRETRFPTRTVEGVQVTRTTFVAPDAPFARELVLIRNPTGATIAPRVLFERNLGTDDGSRVLATSSGDATLAHGDRWVVLDQPDDPEDSIPGIIFDGLRGGQALRAESELLVDGEITTRYATELAPGETAAFMQVLHAGRSGGEAVALLQREGDGPAAIYAGLSDGERAALRNWPADPDTDRDGVGDATDGCVTVPAPGGCPAPAPAPAPPVAAPAPRSSTPPVLGAARRVRDLRFTASVRGAGRRVRIGVRGTLVPPSGAACGGKVTIRVVRGDRTRATLRRAVGRDCRFTGAVRVSRRAVGARPSVKVTFEGTRAIAPATARARLRVTGAGARRG